MGWAVSIQGSSGAVLGGPAGSAFLLGVYAPGHAAVLGLNNLLCLVRWNSSWLFRDVRDAKCMSAGSC